MEWIEWNGPPTVHTIDFMEGLCRRILEEVSFSHTDRLLFAVHEGLINAVEATKVAYGQTLAHPISIRIAANGGLAEIQISDSAGGISAQSLQKLETGGLGDALLEESGRGLLLIKHLADEVFYQVEGDMTTLIIRKRGN
ncbi:ATP-binding protein [Ectobacillus ponti]|uniref:ATP-binding protein n=1 Tax=Ectobacillus ponti TaxID=2961894 RepID=A0AA42BQ42_9BACI|nr:ATP-binding protein [Ectobacillus ponti]MCP8969462.1 ATP-binding protein [Ectobacillus ponti]